MKQLFFTLITIFLASNLMAVNVWDGSSEPWTNGSGTESDPYLIETAANLAYLAEKVNEGYQAQGSAVFRHTYFLMTDDFDLNDINWTPIGNVNMNMEGYYFAGIFDAWYHNIDHLKIQSSADVCGLFGGLGGEWGGIIGENDFGQIRHLSVTNGNITSTGTGAGGIVGGMADNAMLFQCSFSGTITVSNNGSFCGVGGIVALAAENSVVEECSFSGSINATNNGGFTAAAGAGGIVGIAMNKAQIKECYNTATITANATFLSVAAGILGATLQENEVSIESCYNVGTLNASTKGGIFGMVSPINPTKGATSLSVTNCYFLNTCGGTTAYGTSMTSAEMQTEEFKNTVDYYAHAYVMDDGTNNGYPIHGLSDYKVWEASDITATSAKLSADIHQGNGHFAEAKFIYYDMDDGAINEMYNVIIDVEDHVELLIEDLIPDTLYGYSLSLKFDDGLFWVSSPRYFTTESNVAVPSFEAPAVLAYPNPATDIVNIQGVEASEIQVFNTLGQLVKTVKGSNEVNVSELPAGNYLLRIISAKPETLYVLPLSKHSH